MNSIQACYALMHVFPCCSTCEGAVSLIDFILREEHKPLGLQLQVRIASCPVPAFLLCITRPGRTTIGPRELAFRLAESDICLCGTSHQKWCLFRPVAAIS